MNNKTENFLMLAFFVAIVYICINCILSAIDFAVKPGAADGEPKAAGTNVSETAAAGVPAK